MAEAGPSNPVSSFKFPPTLADSTVSEASKSIGLGPPPIFRNPPQTHDTSRHNRRRINSESLQNSGPIGNKKTLQSLNRASMKAEKRPAHILDVPDPGLDAFSDEYDLAHEDPGIMEDVQRALKMKARREARLKTLSLNSSGKDSSRFPEFSPRSSFSTGSPPTTPSRMSTGITFPPSNGFDAGESEVDFRPSVSATASHPVPRSTDDGATLDWSGDKLSDEKLDRRWSLSITKRKPKDKAILAVDKPIVENQGYAYTEKLVRIRTRAKPLTLRKASMTADQLQRRYTLVYASITGPTPVHLTSVVRWHMSQESIVRNSLERSEPSTWLKHLERKPAKRARSSWNVTALVVEEYMRIQARDQSMQTIPEDSAVISAGHAPSKVELGVPRSTMTSHKLNNSALLKRQAHERPSLFDPPSEPNADSPKARRSESSQSAWKHIQSDTDSQKSSNHSVFNWSRSRPASPASSHLHVPDLALRRKSDEISSARNSPSEGHSQPEPILNKQRQHARPSNLELQSLNEAGLDGDSVPPLPKSSAATARNLEGIQTTQRESKTNLEAEGTVNAAYNAKRSARLHRVRMSLPSSDRLLYREEEKRQKQADEEKERQEYEVRAQLLEGAIKQNYRIRQVLQRITGEIKEFNGVQSSGLLGVPCISVPHEVLDAFSHDPSAVTGSTRRLKGWRAVDDIHARVTWQREVLRNFVTSVAGSKEQFSMPTGIFDGSIAALMESVAHLENQRDVIIDKADEVTDLLARVREMHGLVKAEFNDTLAHTSQIYPEISQISALEENYRNRYQQVWAIGMDALTFILDSVTPFWRTYGKTIGIDIQDFLIIPWYRNEFTGESKRYSIRHIPKRSFRHWLSLLMLPTITIMTMILQARTAIFSFGWILKTLFLSNPGLWTIFLPFLVTGVIVQWAVVLFELSIIIAQVGVVIWWIGWSIGLYT